MAQPERSHNAKFTASLADDEEKAIWKFSCTALLVLSKLSSPFSFGIFVNSSPIFSSSAATSTPRHRPKFDGISLLNDGSHFTIQDIA